MLKFAAGNGVESGLEVGNCGENGALSEPPRNLERRRDPWNMRLPPCANYCGSRITWHSASTDPLRIQAWPQKRCVSR
jgi:hypothetical protein